MDKIPVLGPVLGLEGVVLAFTVLTETYMYLVIMLFCNLQRFVAVCLPVCLITTITYLTSRAMALLLVEFSLQLRMCIRYVLGPGVGLVACVLVNISAHRFRDHNNNNNNLGLSLRIERKLFGTAARPQFSDWRRSESRSFGLGRGLEVK